MVTTHGFATLAELEAIMEIDFSEDFDDAAGTPQVSDTTIEARGSDIEEFLIGLTHVTYTSATIPADVKAYFKKAWEMDIEKFLWKRGIKILKFEPTDDWTEFLKSKFAEVIEDNIQANTIADFDSVQDYRS